MKNTLIRIVTIAVIALSSSTFAVSENAQAANDKDHNNTNTEQAAVPVAAPQQNSGQGCQPNTGNGGSEDLSQQIRELRQEIRALRDDEQKSMKKLHQQIEEQNKEWIHALQGIYGG